MIVLYILAGIALVAGVLSLAQGMQSIRHIRTYRPQGAWRPQGTWRPQLALFCPCRGVDPGFEDNVRSILDQDYPHFRVTFIVDSESDPAARALKALGATVLVAGPASGRGQKVHNLIYGVAQDPGDAEVFVFCDVDARFPGEWLMRLIAPLERQDVAVATGYRWYVSPSGDFPSLLRSSWNASVVTMLGDHGRNFAWGGSTALRRETFRELEILKAWNGALSDDYAVTQAARRSGRRIVFVPQCLIPTYGECTWSELLEFTTRQIAITRIYDPQTWWTAAIFQTIFNVAFWGTLLPSGPGIPVTFALYALAGAKSYLRCKAVETVLPPEALPTSAASHALLSPVTALLFEYNMVRSAFTRSITWRNIRYVMVSPNETVVESKDAQRG
jgi:cellulose synthase/poly-beta-1,6-N-acetylglucosamine synthase-like glycosyltransferase